MEIQTDANDIAVEPRGGPHSGDAPRGRATNRCIVNLRQGEVGGHASEIVIEIFDLQSPMAREQPFEAAAGRPAELRIRESAVAEDGRIWGVTQRFHSGKGGAPIDAAISETAGRIGEQPLSDEKAETDTCGAEIVGALRNVRS